MSYPHNYQAIHPEPTVEYELDHVQYYARAYRVVHYLLPRLLPLNTMFPVEVVNGYIVGYVLDGFLYPFVAPRADLHGSLGMVKIHIDGMVNVPILPADPIHDQFFNQDGTRPGENIHYAIRHNVE